MDYWERRLLGVHRILKGIFVVAIMTINYRQGSEEIVGLAAAASAVVAEVGVTGVVIVEATTTIDGRDELLQ